MSEKLKPCPFCGGQAAIYRAEKYHTNNYCYFVTCLVCGVEMPRIAKSRQQAQKVWNRRVDNNV